jgi:3-oxoacyl-[acyl-carrier protein] reductase
MDTKKFDGKVALVTAAAGVGIGRAVARRYGQEGATVVVTDAHERRAKETAELLSSELGRPVLGIKLDVLKQSDIDSCIDEVLKAHGQIDILYNNAGINKLSPVWKMSDADWDLVIGVCLTGTFRMVRAVLPQMIERKTGAIINVSSIAGLHNDPGGDPGESGQSAYASAKAGIMGFTRQVAAEVGPFGVRVNAVIPGLIYNEFLEKVYDKAWFKNKEMETPLRKMGQPEHVAGLASYLAGADSEFITGECICISGGRYMHT